MKNKLYFLFILLPLIAISITYTGFAQQRVYRGQIIEPVFTDISLKKGDSYKGNIKFFNDLEIQHTLSLTISASDFLVGPDGKSKDENVTLPKTASLASWITLPIKKISVPSGQNTDIPFTINIPQDAEYGGKYASITLTADKSNITNTAETLPIQTRIQHTLLVNIEGHTVENLGITDFHTDKPVYDMTDVEFIADIKNLGNVHIAPKGTIRIDGGWIGTGDTISFNNSSPDSTGYVLPDPRYPREYTENWSSKGFHFGPYKAILTIQYGSGTQKSSLTSTTTFWIIPWKYIIYLVVFIIVLIIIIFIIKKRRKRLYIFRS